MIFSRKHNFLFLKGRKVGGTSVEIALSCLCGPDDIVTPITPIDERLRLTLGGKPLNYAFAASEEEKYLEAIRNTPVVELGSIQPPKAPFYNHMPLHKVLEQIPSAAETPVIFAERNPYAKVLSWANMAARFESYNAGGEMITSVGHLRHAVAGVISDESFFKVRNIDLYRRASAPISGVMLRYESLVDDYLRIIADLGVANAPALPHAKRGMLSNSLDPLKYFTGSQIDIVNKGFAEEFATFGYEML